MALRKKSTLVATVSFKLCLQKNQLSRCTMPCFASFCFRQPLTQDDQPPVGNELRPEFSNIEGKNEVKDSPTSSSKHLIASGEALCKIEAKSCDSKTSKTSKGALEHCNSNHGDSDSASQQDEALHTESTPRHSILLPPILKAPQAPPAMPEDEGLKPRHRPKVTFTRTDAPKLAVPNPDADSCKVQRINTPHHKANAARFEDAAVHTGLPPATIAAVKFNPAVPSPRGTDETLLHRKKTPFLLGCPRASDEAPDPGTALSLSQGGPEGRADGPRAPCGGGTEAAETNPRTLQGGDPSGSVAITLSQPADLSSGHPDSEELGLGGRGPAGAELGPARTPGGAAAVFSRGPTPAPPSALEGAADAGAIVPTSKPTRRLGFSTEAEPISDSHADDSPLGAAEQYHTSRTDFNAKLMAAEIELIQNMSEKPVCKNAKQRRHSLVTFEPPRITLPAKVTLKDAAEKMPGEDGDAAFVRTCTPHPKSGLVMKLRELEEFVTEQAGLEAQDFDDDDVGPVSQNPKILQRKKTPYRLGTARQRRASVSDAFFDATRDATHEALEAVKRLIAGASLKRGAPRVMSRSASNKSREAPPPGSKPASGRATGDNDAREGGATDTGNAVGAQGSARQRSGSNGDEGRSELVKDADRTAIQLLEMMNSLSDTPGNGSSFTGPRSSVNDRAVGGAAVPSAPAPVPSPLPVQSSPRTLAGPVPVVEGVEAGAQDMDHADARRFKMAAPFARLVLTSVQRGQQQHVAF